MLVITITITIKITIKITNKQGIHQQNCHAPQKTFNASPLLPLPVHAVKLSTI